MAAVPSPFRTRKSWLWLISWLFDTLNFDTYVYQSCRKFVLWSRIKWHESNRLPYSVSGSAKTVLLSSFYGLAAATPLTELFDVLVGDNAQGRRLHQSYLGMKNSALLPTTNRFSATS